MDGKFTITITETVKTVVKFKNKLNGERKKLKLRKLILNFTYKCSVRLWIKLPIFSLSKTNWNVYPGLRLQT